MSSKALLMILLYFLFGVHRGANLCSTRKEFNLENSNLETENFKKYKDDPKVDLLQFLMFNPKPLSSGGFGKVYELKEFPDIIIKKVTMKPDEGESFYMREIKALKYVCNYSKDRYLKLSDCESKFIASFYGCVRERSTLYLFQEKMSWDFLNKHALAAYRKLPALERVKVMLDIIDRFIELHRLNLVHSDIKPENIMMKKKDFSDFKIIDLGVASKLGGRFVGGTPGYLPPERYRSKYRSLGVNFNQDVFALGMTFAEIEGDFDQGHDPIRDKCFEYEENYRACQKLISKGLKTAFSESKKLNSLIPLIEKAINFDRKSRFQTMTDFSDALIQKLIGLEGAEPFIQDIIASKDENDKPKSYWKEVLASMNLTSKDSQKTEKKTFMSWASSLFICQASKKTKKNKVQNENKSANNEKINNDNIRKLEKNKIITPEIKKEDKVLL